MLFNFSSQATARSGA